MAAGKNTGHLLSVLCINLDSNQYHLQQSIIAPYISLPRYSKIIVVSFGSLPDIRRLQMRFYVCTWTRTSVLAGQHGLGPWQPTIPTGHANCQSLFNQGLLPVVQLLKSPLYFLAFMSFQRTSA